MENSKTENRTDSLGNTAELEEAAKYLKEKGVELGAKSKTNQLFLSAALLITVGLDIYILSRSRSTENIVIALVVMLVVSMLLYVQWCILLKLKEIELLLAGYANREAKSRMEQAGLLDHVSHNIRTPINAIIGLIKMAKDQTKDEGVLKILDKLTSSTDYLFSLLQDVLDISHIDSGKTRLDLKPVLLADIADEALSMIRVGLAEKNQSINILRQDRDGITVLADAPRIQEVLVNILLNAVKFSREGGSISFSAQTKPGRKDNEIRAIYTISDNGVGMSEEVARSIFDEFSETKNSTNGLGTEIGLGMPITKKIVDLMEGTISVDSKEGVGSTFVVDLPLELTDMTGGQTEQAGVKKLASISGMKALLAEDNTMNAEIAAYMLENKDIDVTVVEDGQKAVDTFASSPVGSYDVILMDVMMPKLNGYEATQAIRALDRADAKTIPIIAMTANAFAEDVKKALDSGMNAHLSKPVREDHLVRVIAKEVTEAREAAAHPAAATEAAAHPAAAAEAPARSEAAKEAVAGQAAATEKAAPPAEEKKAETESKSESKTETKTENK